MRRVAARGVAATVAAVAIAAGCAPDAAPSAVVGVIVDDACDPGIETGSGAIVAPGLVLTAAHVLTGAVSIRVIRDGRSVIAEVVGFDPEMDLAYLAIDGLTALPLEVSSDGLQAGDTGVAYVVRDNETVEIEATAVRRVNIETEDIYLEGETSRPGIELDAEVQGGDSGGAVVIGGKVVGVVWARSRAAGGRSYAIDPDRAGDRIEEQLRSGELGDDIDLTRCP